MNRSVTVAGITATFSLAKSREVIAEWFVIGGRNTGFAIAVGPVAIMVDATELIFPTTAEDDAEFDAWLATLDD